MHPAFPEFRHTLPTIRLLMGAPAHAGQILFLAADNCLYPTVDDWETVRPIGVAARTLTKSTFVSVGSTLSADVLSAGVHFTLR